MTLMFYCWIILWVPYKLYTIMITEKVTNVTKFGEEDKFNFRLISVTIHTNSGEPFERKDENLLDNIYTPDYKFSVIKYSVNDSIFKFINYKKTIHFPMYETISNPIFIRKICNAFIRVDNKEYMVTKLFSQFMGPKYNFYKDLDLEMNLDDILLTSSIKLPEYKNGIVEIYDNLGAVHTYELPWVPQWEPAVISQS